MTPRHRQLGVLVGIALLFSLMTALPSSADPVSDKRAEAARIQQQLERQGEQVSILAERSNRAQIKVSEVEGSLAKAQDDVARSDERLQVVRNRLAQAAVLAYVHGGNNAFIGQFVRGGKDDMVVRTQYLRVTASDQRQIIGEVRSAKQDFESTKSRLESERKAAADAATAAESASQAARQAENAQRAVLSRVNGELGDLVAAEQARKEAEEARAKPALAPVINDTPRITEAVRPDPLPTLPAAAAPQAKATTTTVARSP